MPDSMYDKLGELLNEALESGNFFSDSKNKTQKNEPPHNENPSASEMPAHERKFTHKTESPKNKTDAPLIPQNVLEKMEFLGIDESDDLKKAKLKFKKKLKRFHPDKNSDNNVMKKITFEKTVEILDAWSVVEKWFLRE